MHAFTVLTRRTRTFFAAMLIVAGLLSVLGPATAGAQIADAAHAGGAGFYFLPPMVPNPGPFSGTFDATLSPVATICKLNTGATPACASGAPIASFTKNGKGASALTVDTKGQSYNAIWSVPSSQTFATSPSQLYRLEVFSDSGKSVRLGYADIWVVATNGGLGGVPAGDIGAVKGMPFQIKFRVETRAVSSVTVAPASATIAKNGTQVFTATVKNLHNATIANPTVTWTSSDTAIATVTSPGVTTTTTGVGSGTATITATSGGVSGTATLQVNRPPTANADRYSVDEDTALSVPASGVLSNDSDPDGDAITAVLVTNVSHGSLTLNSNGSFSYTPSANYNGTDSFTYTARDSTGATSSAATVTITVNPVNDAPTTSGDNVTLAEDTPTAITLKAADVDHDTLSYTITTAPSHGTLSGTAPNLTYTPTANYNGPDSFSFKVNDGTVDSNVSTVSITVTAVNDAPVAANDSYTTAEDTAFDVGAPGVLGNDSDVDSPSLTAILVNGPSHGTLTLNPDGSFHYSPAANFNGTDSFTYKANDGAADSTAATVSITVTPVNDAPVAQNDSYSTNEDTALNANVLSNDSDVDGDSLSAVLVSGPAHGTLNLNADGSFTYTPAANYNGSDSFTYKANDGSLDSNVATVSLTVNAVNDPPVAADQSVTTDEDTAKAISLTATDVEGDALSYSVVAGPQHGTLSGTAPNLTYTPNANYNGSDSFTFKANDGQADSNVATVTITVSPVNDAPVATNDSFSTDEDTVLNGNVLSNDTDVDGDTLHAAQVSGPAHGTLTLNADGSFSYSPAANYNGTDSFTYKANDGSLDSNVATVNLTVNAVNDAPVAVGDTYNTNGAATLTVPAPGVLSNDSDVDSPSLTAILVSSPSHGTLTLNSDGSFSYTADAGTTSDSFSYKANDGSLDSNVATVTISINAPPVANPQSVTTNEDTATTITLTASDADGDPLTYTVGSPSHGTLSGSAPNLTYTPAANYNGPDSFTFTVNDGHVDSPAATVSITVNPVNDAPVAANDNYSTDEDTVLNGNVLSNDTDVDGDTLHAALVSGPAHGTLALSADGSFTYTPAANYHGADSFTYKANDGQVDSNVATVSITVNSVNDPPTVSDQSVTTNEDTATPITLAASDADGDPLTYTVSSPSHGMLSGTAPNLTYTPAANFNGTDAFTYKVNDGTVDSNTATISITVIAVNDPPVAGNGSYSTDEDTQLTVPAPGVLSNDSDVDSPSLTAILVSGPSHGTLTLNSDGSFSYSPAANYHGADSFTYKANDGTVDSNTATVNLTVNSVNDPPTASDQLVSTKEDTATPITLTASDVDGDPLTYTVSSPSNGTLSGTAPNLTYTPAANFNGTDSFTFKVNDGTVDSNTATISITVNAVNDAPSFTASNPAAVNEDAGAQTLTGWAAFSPGPANESSQTVVGYTVSNLVAASTLTFSAAPAVDASGTLTYTPAANAYGTATFSVRVQDSGGTTNGGVDTSPTQTFTITVNAVNDVPSFTKGGDQTVNEDAGAQSVTGWATAISAGPNEASQTVSFEITNSNAGLFSTAPAVDSTGKLSYTPAADAFGTATITLDIKDNGGTANGGVDTSATQTFTITVNAVNDPPTVSNTTRSFTARANLDLSISGTTQGGGLLTGASDKANEVAQGSILSVHGTGGLLAAAPTATTQGGILSINAADGTFSYTPPAGYVGSDSFSYVVCDTGYPAPGLCSTTVTVTFTVQGPVVWFIDNTAGATGATGTLSHPFNSLAAYKTYAASVGTRVATGQIIYLATGNATYTDASGLSLLDTQKLIGQGATGASLEAVAGIGGSLPAGSAAYPAINGTRPTLGVALTLASGNTVRGLNVSAGTGISGASVGALTIADVNVTSTAGLAVNLTGGSSMGVTFGSVSATNSNGGGVSLQTSSGTTTINALTISNTNGTGLLANNAGTLVISGANNTIGTTTGTALNVTGTTIGSSGLTFKSVAANGGTNGIVLNATGSSGGLTVGGNGSAGSGGTIRNGATGISLTNTANVSLSYMQLNDFTDFAIRGDTVSGFMLANTVINGTNGNTDTTFDGSVRFTGLTGSASVTNCTISGGYTDNFYVSNSSGTLNRLTISGTTFGANSTDFGNDAVTVEALGTATVNVTIQNSTFTASRGDHIQTTGGGSSTMDVVISGNTLSNNHPAPVSGGGGTVSVTTGATNSTSTLTFNIANNTTRDARGTAIFVAANGGTSTASGSITGNTVGVAGVANSGSKEGSGIEVLMAESAKMTATVNKNTVSQYNNFGIYLQAGGGAVGAAADAAVDLDVTVQSNTISNPGNNPAVASAKNGIQLNSSTSSTEPYLVRLVFGGAGSLANSIVGSGADPGGFGTGQDFRLRQRTTSTVRLVGYTGMNNDNNAVVAFGQAQNNIGGTPSGLASNTVPTGGGFVSGP